MQQIHTDKNSEDPPAGRAGLYDLRYQRSILRKEH